MNPSLFQLFETKYWNVVLLEEQRYLGRSVVELKRECGDLADLTEEEILDFFQIIAKMQDLLRKTFDATMFNWACLMNNAYQEVTPKPQIHWHFIPRYNHEVTFVSETFKDINFGHHHLKNGEGDRIVSPELRTKIAEELRNNL